MLTKNEITALSLSPTKKDFVQIWNELLEVAGKLSERWDPTSTNESDPGIVILKALTGIADKLNYNIDKNTLEAFMPTAAQEDSMRKLCDMLGYNVKYYRSAETEVTIKFYNSDTEADASTQAWLIPKFTVITNSDQDISYFTTNQTPYFISATTPSVTVPCMEGQLVKCESTTDNNVITIAQISENNRFYLPEAQIAENGIFVYNVFSDNNTLADGIPWDKVDNLNIQAQGSRVFKFGYDSYESRPYIEFPADYSELIKDGLFIYYARTSGANGNVSPRTLTQLEIPSSWTGASAENFSVENVFAATTGANVETIKQAYNNFKKTVGTFETLVTCRDYMNKIYTMTDALGKALVSNILVTDIRNDLNRAITICSCDNAGIFYKEMPLITDTIVSSTTKTVGTETIIERVVTKELAIDHFDLVLYPFKTYTQIRGNVTDVQDVYDASFKYSYKNFKDIKSILDESGLKTIAHNLISPRQNDLISINNYLRLSAIIGTNSKITVEEGELLKDTIKIALANAFNMRELDFGEEIPFESIVEVIENADARIKVVSLNEPALYTTFSVFEGTDTSDNPIIKEYAVASDWLTVAEGEASDRFSTDSDTEPTTFNTTEAKLIYNKLAVRNVLAGRVPLFKYNNIFKTNFSEGAYRITQTIPEDEIPKAMAKPTVDEPFVMCVHKDSVIDPDPGDNPGGGDTPGGGGDNPGGGGDDPEGGDTPDEPIDDDEALAELLAEGQYKVYTGQLTMLSEAEKPAELIIPSVEVPATQYIDEEGVIYTGEWNEAIQAPVYQKVMYTKTFTPELYEDNIITKADDDNNITEITTSCIIKSDPYNPGSKQVSDVTLSTGEFIRFRAPNFITDKTYPAYVNYHLALQKDIQENAVAADAVTLFSLLNKMGDNGEPYWANVLNYFSIAGRQTNRFTLTQKVTKAVSDTTPKLEIDNPSADTPEETPEDILAKSGCIKLCNNGRPTFRWADKSAGGPALNVEDFTLTLSDGSLYISNSSTISKIQTAVDNYILNSTQAADVPKDWTISYEFEYVPFMPSTLADWENFIKQNGTNLFGFTPEVENDIILWRAYGEGYSNGKYILSSTAKLMPFTSSYFGLLTNFTSRLHGIYIAKSLGKDQKANYISNNEEYKLRDREYLYIEYTPSSTTEDGTTQTGDSVKEIHGPGTIIKPSGFEAGLIDSSAFAADGNSYTKTVVFNETNIAMFSLGANEQIELREYAQVTLDKNSLAENSTIYVYKNFTNCPELEEAQYEGGERINNTYTLKDGEYICYTDQNKAEFAYYTSGTEVTLTGKVKIPKLEIIDLATVLDAGLQEIPWHRLSMSSNDGISFQEYQYVTLGPGDTLKDLTLVGTNDYISEQWQYCDNIAYLQAGAENTSTLPTINVVDSSSRGSGWEVCSILELNVSANNAQTLRTTDKVETSITLHKATASGVATFATRARRDNSPIVLAAEDKAHSLSFKTNVACQSSNSKLNINDLYTNPDNAKSFELKVFSNNDPIIIKTEPGKVVPYHGTTVTDITSWETDKPAVTKGANELWSQVVLTDIASEDLYDNALKLSISLIPNTYGLFSIYLDYDKATTTETWIELIPGTPKQAISLVNVDTPVWRSIDAKSSKLMLNAGLNCVQVNTTTDIFIKASSGAGGTLCFDELRLIDYDTVSYTEDGVQKIAMTKGLNIEQLGYFYTSDEDMTLSSDTAYKTMKLEEQLLSDIRAVDQNRIFYYNVPVEANVAIDFTESDYKLNTLLNPLTNYDINNMNNNFVISKLDFDYLDKGIQIARSSRLG